MTRECHVRFCESLGVKLPGATVRPAKAGVFSRRQTCRGKSQRPRSLDSRVAGNQDSEAYRQAFPWGMRESSGRNKSERDVASKKGSSEGRASSRRVKAAWVAEILTDTAIPLRRGGSDGTMTRTC
jgi:hypothetical protein